MTEPNSQSEIRLQQIWEDCFRINRISVSADFFDLGGHSFLAARIFQRIAREFQCQLPVSTLLTAPTIRELAAVLDNGAGDVQGALVPIQTGGTALPLFCVHGGGGDVLTYRKLAQALGPGYPLWGLRRRPLSGNARQLKIEPTAEAYLQEMRAVRPNGPYLIGGHSFGALVAFEMAKRLVDQGEQVAMLAVLDHPGPGARRTLRHRFKMHLLSLSQLNRRERFRYLLDGVSWVFRSRSWLPRWLSVAFSRATHLRDSRQQARFRVDTVQAAIRAMAQYRVSPTHVRVTLFRAKHGPPAVHSDPMGGWGGVALDGVVVHDVPGTHMNLFQPPHVDQLANKLRREIDACTSAAAETDHAAANDHRRASVP